VKPALKIARGARSLTVAAVLILGLGACSGGATTGGGSARNDLGAVGFALALVPGETLESASYTINGPGGFSKTGTVNLANSASVSTTIGGLPASSGYVITIGATTVDGTIACAGSAAFAVVAHQTTAVMIHLTCHEAPLTGSVLVNGTVNVCPTLTSVGASPAEVVVGEPVALAAAAVDRDAAPAALSYHWTVSSGALDDASVASPTFTCLFAGPVTVTVAVSDGDPSPGCADSLKLSLTCTAAAPRVYAWVELGSGGQAIARLVTPDTSCPPIFVDGRSLPMRLRVGAGTVPLRPTASTPANSKPSEFPVTTCELAIPAGAQEVVAAGRALPLPRTTPNRIVVIGDTGCRMKIGNPFQACSDPNEWPLQQIATSAAATAPDLVLHVGDYHYRENACPADIAGCQGSPWGYGWDVWEQDLFKPAGPLMAVAPWVLVRGNHEECARGGQGWYRFLDTGTYDEARSCNSAANDDLANYNLPYAVPVGGDTQLIVFDSAKAGGAALNPASATDAVIFARYQSQLQAVAALAADPSVFSIFTNHHPLLAFTSVAGANPIGGNAALLSVFSATFPGAYFPPNIKLVLEGHNHIFEAIDFATPHPVHILSGNGGDNLDINLPDPFPLGPAASGGVEPAPGAVVDQIAHMSGYGFLVLDRATRGWTVKEYRRDGTLMDTCALDSASDKISCATQGFLH
jgi:Calcineurin-like phosphoesterase